jgi:CHASE3 domain sensor protein
MQVTNRKERAKAKWRFAGLYILSVALPVLLLLNAIGMNKVECDDTAQYANQLRQRDQALAELSQLAAMLNEAHQLKSAFDRAPEDQARYDRLHYEFE